MNFQDCIEFAQKAGGCTLATMDGDQPRVRAMGPLWLRRTASTLPPQLQRIYTAR